MADIPRGRLVWRFTLYHWSTGAWHLLYVWQRSISDTQREGVALCPRIVGEVFQYIVQERPADCARCKQPASVPLKSPDAPVLLVPRLVRGQNRATGTTGRSRERISPLHSSGSAHAAHRNAVGYEVLVQGQGVAWEGGEKIERTGPAGFAGPPKRTITWYD